MIFTEWVNISPISRMLEYRNLLDGTCTEYILTTSAKLPSVLLS